MGSKDNLSCMIVLLGGGEVLNSAFSSGSCAAKCKDSQTRFSIVNCPASACSKIDLEVPGEKVEFIPGPFKAPENGAFRKAGDSDTELASFRRVRCCKPCKAYAAMAEHAGLTLSQALEKLWA